MLNCLTRSAIGFLVVAFSLVPVLGKAQQDTILLDKIIAVVGGSAILESEIRNQVNELKKQNKEVSPGLRCELLEELLLQKLLLAQAKRDSISVTDLQVENELDRRLKFFISRFGGNVDAFEEYYGKSLQGFKDDYREDVRNMMMIQQMQNKITGDVDVSPLEVSNFFNSLPADSIPFINAEIEIGEIVKKPAVNPELKAYAKSKCEELRARALKGEDFTFLVKAYSMDPGSNGKGGAPTKYENIARGTFVPEFDQYAFSMNPGEISPVFETSFGFHVMKLLVRKGEYVDLQHILIQIESAPEDLVKARNFLDSLRTMILKDSISFTEAASRFSDDEDSKINGGSIFNPIAGTFRFEMDQISQFDPTLFLVIDKLGPKEISQPGLTMTRDSKQAYRIIYVKSRTQPHKANLKDDYQRIKEEAVAAKEEKLLREWVARKVPSVYVWISDEYKNCNFETNWIQK
jgi:peptidyl-prolyl cis-trans isomerase SurA